TSFKCDWSSDVCSSDLRNWPAFLASVSTFMVKSISALVMLPLSAYLYWPVASTTRAASMMPIEGMLRIEALPLNSGLSSSAQDRSEERCVGKGRTAQGG